MDVPTQLEDQMHGKRRLVAALFAGITVITFAAWAGWTKPRPLHAQSVTAHYFGPDQEAPEGAFPWPCPSEWYFHIQVYSDYSSTRYFFWLNYGAITGYSGIGSGTYKFGDVKSTTGAATLLAVTMNTDCERVDYPDDWVLYVIQTGTIGNNGLKINTTPYTDSSPVQTEHEGTYDTYCLFTNYFDDDWNYLYSEEIPGTCWTVETT
jgi:hypothetical protein